MSVNKKPSSPAAKARVEEAMRHIENAQHELERAAQILSCLRFGNDLCKKAGKLGEHCHAFFYKLRDAGFERAQMSTDSECPKCFADLSSWRYGVDPPHVCLK